MPTCSSPRLIAAYRVLLRQSVPWHPPCALVRLILPRFHFSLLRLCRRNLSTVFFCFVFVFTDFSCVVFKVRLKFHFSAIPQNDTVKSYSQIASRALRFWTLSAFRRFCVLLEHFCRSFRLLTLFNFRLLRVST